jgi:SNF2 family DNA or RNA helicase
MRQELESDCEGKDAHRENELRDIFYENEHMEILKRDKKVSSEMLPVEKIKLKPTVILTSVSLMGQWEDECKKHAPGLVVKTFHSSRTKNRNNISHWQLRDTPSLNKIDLIISTSTFNWPAFGECYIVLNGVVTVYL